MAAVLNRLITLEFENGRKSVVLEPDPRHVDLLINKTFNLDKGDAKGVATPAGKQSIFADATPLSGYNATLFRSGTMRANSVAPDLPQTQFTVNKSSRCMAAPSKG